MKPKTTKNILVGIVIIILGMVGFTHSEIKTITNNLFNSMISTQVSTLPSQQTKKPNTGDKSGTNTTTDANRTIDQDTYHQLADLEFHSGDSAVQLVNNGKSTLNVQEWKEPHVFYGDLDSLNRTTNVTAYIDRKSLGRSEGRQRQVWKPTGWHQKKISGKEIYNRGHLLAYTSSFNFDMDGKFKQGTLGSIDNPKNLATQSAFSNQKVQTYYENLVRKAQKIYDNKVVFQIVTVFRANELMPRGYWLQAKDSSGKLNFNVYEFNVQPKIIFNYSDGSSKMDQKQQITWAIHEREEK